MKNFINLNPKTSIILSIILVIFPKIDLIPIPGYWQGIRVEDFIILFFMLYILFNLDSIFSKFKINKFQYKNFYYFFFNMVSIFYFLIHAMINYFTPYCFIF